MKDVEEFLRLVAEGEQEKAEAMLDNNRALALLSGDVTDLSGRKFTNITGFQYAVWALDWHMWKMIRKCLPVEEAKRQADGFYTGDWVKRHGVHANLMLDKRPGILDSLIKAYQTTIALYKDKKFTEGNAAWVQKVGRAQSLLPVHVVNEYCHPIRSFDPHTNFKDKSDLCRSRKIYKGNDGQDWFTASYFGGKLGENFAVVYNSSQAQPRCMPTNGGGAGWVLGRGERLGERDLKSISELITTRMAQREKLISKLKRSPAQTLNPTPISNSTPMLNLTHMPNSVPEPAPALYDRLFKAISALTTDVGIGAAAVVGGIAFSFKEDYTVQKMASTCLLAFGAGVLARRAALGTAHFLYEHVGSALSKHGINLVRAEVHPNAVRAESHVHPGAARAESHIHPGAVRAEGRLFSVI